MLQKRSVLQNKSHFACWKFIQIPANSGLQQTNFRQPCTKKPIWEVFWIFFRYWAPLDDSGRAIDPLCIKLIWISAYFEPFFFKLTKNVNWYKAHFVKSRLCFIYLFNSEMANNGQKVNIYQKTRFFIHYAIFLKHENHAMVSGVGEKKRNQRKFWDTGFFRRPPIIDVLSKNIINCIKNEISRMRVC